SEIEPTRARVRHVSHVGPGEGEGDAVRLYVQDQRAYRLGLHRRLTYVEARVVVPGADAVRHRAALGVEGVDAVGAVMDGEQMVDQVTGDVQQEGAVALPVADRDALDGDLVRAVHHHAV